MILLFLRYNHISFYQSSNFVWSLSNYPGSRTIFFGIVTCMLLFTITGAGTLDISVSICLYSSEASFIIYKNPSHSDNAFILSVLLELILVSLCSLHYMCFVCYPAVTLPSFVCEIFHYTSLAR